MKKLAKRIPASVSAVLQTKYEHDKVETNCVTSATDTHFDNKTKCSVSNYQLLLKYEARENSGEGDTKQNSWKQAERETEEELN